jgi:hypothetical protein
VPVFCLTGPSCAGKVNEQNNRMNSKVTFMIGGFK